MSVIPIELVTWHERQAGTAVQELVHSMFANSEPGFQIDGVTSISDLYEVFEAVKLGMPDGLSSRFDFNSFQTGLRPPEAGRSSTIAPHLDVVEVPEGLAVHQNIAGKGTLLLAHVLGDKYMLPRSNSIFDPDYSQLEDVRTGALVAGRLTVFSEGRFETMRPALHFFDRRGYSGSDRWIRYAYSPANEVIAGKRTQEARLHDLAQTAFNLFNKKRAAA